MEHIHNCILDLGFELYHPLFANKDQDSFNPEIWAGLEEFREHLGGQLTIMLLDEIGHGVEVHEMHQEILAAAVMTLVERAGNP